MIKRITDPAEFEKLVGDIFRLHKDDIDHNAHFFIKHNPESIIANFSHTQVLAWHIYVWANHNGEHYDAVIVFSNDRNPMFGSRLFSEHLWVSKNPKIGYKLLKAALSFADKEDFDYVIMSAAEKSVNSETVKRFYGKMGFVKDSETYIAKL